MRVISLGWGVQSFALAAMSALGKLPPVDAAIHADTTHERSETYAFAKRWTPWLERHGVKVVTVKPKVTDLYDKWGGLMLPVYTTYPDGKKSGMMHRQCTNHWKIKPIRRWIQANRKGKQAEQWLGITLDEWTRMKDANVQYVKNTYPFMDFFEQPWSRGKVTQWLHNNDLEIPVKSSCVFCPFHDFATWREIKLSDNGDWKQAIFTDCAIRKKRENYICYLCATYEPLDEVDLRNEQDHGQLELWGEECTGMCFL